MSNFVVYETESGCKFRCTQAQADTLDKLASIIKGGIGTVNGYVAKSGRVTPEKANIQFVTAFSTDALYERKAAALKDLTYDEVAEFAEQHQKVKELSPSNRVALFEERKQQELASLNKTLDGDRSDNYRQAHDRCYCYVGHGVKVHYVTVDEKYIEDGKQKKRKVPDLVAGLPVCDSIMLTILELNREVIEPGEYKQVNSGASVLIKNAMLKGLNLRSVGLKTLSLREDTFDSLVVSRKKILSEDVEGFPSELFNRD